jgi:glycerol uptake facilitator-like aquaporin
MYICQTEYDNVAGSHPQTVTLALTARGHLSKQLAAPYVVAQLVGACAGVACAHVMFGRPLFVMSERVRAGSAQMFSEFVATFGLLAVIWSCSRTRSRLAPIVVAGYIVSAYWFTASTSFANPAVTIARALTNTFAGIRLFDVPAFLVAQLLGAGTATALFTWLLPEGAESDV